MLHPMTIPKNGVVLALACCLRVGHGGRARNSAGADALLREGEASTAMDAASPSLVDVERSADSRGALNPANAQVVFATLLLVFNPAHAWHGFSPGVMRKSGVVTAGTHIQGSNPRLTSGQEMGIGMRSSGTHMVMLPSKDKVLQPEVFHETVGKGTAELASDCLNDDCSVEDVKVLLAKLQAEKSPSPKIVQMIYELKRILKEGKMLEKEIDGPVNLLLKGFKDSVRFRIDQRFQDYAKSYDKLNGMKMVVKGLLQLYGSTNAVIGTNIPDNLVSNYEGATKTGKVCEFVTKCLEDDIPLTADIADDMLTKLRAEQNMDSQHARAIEGLEKLIARRIAEQDRLSEVLGSITA